MKKDFLITGACGFVGSHLTEYLVKKGCSVVAFDRYNPNNDLGWLSNSKYKKDIEFILGDIRDYDSVYNSLSKCNSCIHLAALIGIPYSYISPLAYIRTNIEGTYNVLEASKNINLDQVIVTSTSETYGSAQYLPINEEHPLVGQSPYSASKISADHLAISYFRSFNLPIKIIRPFNIYGPRQSTRAIIPTIITQLTRMDEKIKLGNVDTKRDFTYVDDVCNAYFEIVNMNKNYGVPINVGTNKNISILELFNLIKLKMKVQSKFESELDRIRPDKSEVDELLCNNKFILENTNWSPNIDFSKGLDLTINWIKDNNDNFDSSNYHV